MVLPWKLSSLTFYYHVILLFYFQYPYPISNVYHIFITTLVWIPQNTERGPHLMATLCLECNSRTARMKEEWKWNEEGGIANTRLCITSWSYHHQNHSWYSGTTWTTGLKTVHWRREWRCKSFICRAFGQIGPLVPFHQSFSPGVLPSPYSWAVLPGSHPTSRPQAAARETRSRSQHVKWGKQEPPALWSWMQTQTAGDIRRNGRAWVWDQVRVLTARLRAEPVVPLQPLIRAVCSRQGQHPWLGLPKWPRCV